MPFEEKDPDKFAPKIGVKKVAGPKSMFDGKVKPPTQQEFQQKVQIAEEKKSGYKSRAADLFIKFNKAILDKTLSQNRNIFNVESEKELLQNMMQLAIEINSDGNELESMGSLTLITCLFKTCLAQRDRINEIEYAMSALQKKLDSSALSDYINKEMDRKFVEFHKELDNKKLKG
jgi:hypothetical protein